MCVYSSEVETEDELTKAEAGQCAEMEVCLQRRLRHLSLTESPSMALMAAMAAQSLDTKDEEEESSMERVNRAHSLSAADVITAQSLPSGALKRAQSDPQLDSR